MYDKESGQLLTGSFMDYAMPRADDFPTFKLDTVCTPCTQPAGHQGLRRPARSVAAGGDQRGVLDALKDLGVKDLDAAIAPRVWEAIQAASEALNTKETLNMYGFTFERPASAGRRAPAAGGTRCWPAVRRCWPR